MCQTIVKPLITLLLGVGTVGTYSKHVVPFGYRGFPSQNMKKYATFDSIIFNLNRISFYSFTFASTHIIFFAHLSFGMGILGKSYFLLQKIVTRKLFVFIRGSFSYFSRNSSSGFLKNFYLDLLLEIDSPRNF